MCVYVHAWVWLSGQCFFWQRKCGQELHWKTDCTSVDLYDNKDWNLTRFSIHFHFRLQISTVKTKIIFFHSSEPSNAAAIYHLNHYVLYHIFTTEHKHWTLIEMSFLVILYDDLLLGLGVWVLLWHHVYILVYMHLLQSRFQRVQQLNLSMGQLFSKRAHGTHFHEPTWALHTWWSIQSHFF